MADSRDELREAAEELVRVVTERLGNLATRPVIHSTAKAAIKAAVDAAGAPKGIKTLHDGRVREWHIKAAIWTADNGVEVDRLEWEGETTATGLDGVAERLRDAALHVFTRGRWDGLPDAMRAHIIAERLENMRPAFSRGGGRANMRYRFDTGRDGVRGDAAYLQATISHREVAERIVTEHAAVDRGFSAIDAANESATAAIRRSGRLPYGPGVEIE